MAKFSTEQEFGIESFKFRIRSMTRNQSQELLVSLYREMLTMENSYRELIKHKWGLENNDSIVDEVA